MPLVSRGKPVAVSSGDGAAVVDPAPDFGARLRTIVGRLRTAGKVVLVPRIPYKLGGDLGAYNAQVDAVRGIRAAGRARFLRMVPRASRAARRRRAP
jgi:hypothetical protein